MRRLWLIFSQAATVALAILFVVEVFEPQWLERAPAPDAASARSVPAPAATTPAPAPAPSAVTAAAGAGFGGFAAAARIASPAVVSVVVTQSTAPNARRADAPWRYDFGERGDAPETLGFGSGVIVSSAGIVLTNNHVVEGAKAIQVRLTDGREANAEIVGTDPDTDLAVLRIGLPRLPVIVLGRTESLQVGDLILAIGNPFNVGQTVTSGIISALGRQGLGLSTFEDFIQTDAAINPGNSGGALVDLQGRLVGINSAIFSRSGASTGIGFAIPVDLARRVMDGLLRDGRVTRGWIGVEPRDLTPEFAENFRLPIRDGVLITGVLADGPASRGGLKPGDVVVSVAGQAVLNTAQLLNAVAALEPGSQATLGVQRGQQALAVTLRVAQRPRPPAPRPR